MTELTPDNFTRLDRDMTTLSGNVSALGKDVTALDKTLSGLQGSIDGLKQSQNTLLASSIAFGALFLGALIYLATQVGALDTRVDGVISGLSDVKDELRLVNQRLIVLEDIRKGIERLTSVEPDPAAPLIASSEDGVVLAGDVDPAAFEAALKYISDEWSAVRMVGADAPAGQTEVIYTSTGLGRIVPGGPSERRSEFETVSNLEQFTEAVGRRTQEHPEGGILLISTSDPTLRDIAGQYGVDFDR